MHGRKLSSRRSFLWQLAAFVSPMVLQQRARDLSEPRPQRASVDKTPVMFAEFKNSYLYDLSPDGVKACLYATSEAVNSFVLQKGRWAKKPRSNGSKDSLLVVN